MRKCGDPRREHALPGVHLLSFLSVGCAQACNSLPPTRENSENTRTMLIRLIYVSKAVGEPTATLTDSILQTAQAWNTQNDITGVLCEGQGVFLQVLEGERGTVTRLYARIFADARHKDLQLIHCETIAERRYGQWSMARVSLSDVDPQTTIVWPDFDPYSANGLLVMARIDELISQGCVIEAPSSPGNG
jgi:hypothetical protein